MLTQVYRLTKSTVCRVIALSAATVGTSASASTMASGAGGEAWKTANSIHEFNVKDIDGNEVSLSKYKGHFGSQEPWSEEEIKKFAQDKYGVQFDMFTKINVNGDNADPLFKYLKKKQKGTLGDFIKWNFSKFLVDKNGQPVKRYSPNTEPFSIEKDFEQYF
ncbi:hypothetical protein BaRGS_00026099 [Batillaria attramentaria]|uniref:Glutathione peroxidase n=1 Tax=Batillaria attramentaria TaxID=370345 RepID=A0ABD0K5N2_9CAEN